MPRPTCCRRVSAGPGASLFKPAGVPAGRLEWLSLGLDELEALRLADLDGLHHEAAAARMGVSRPTFGRIVESARRTVARALCTGAGIEIAGGNVAMAKPCQRERRRCGRRNQS